MNLQSNHITVTCYQLIKILLLICLSFLFTACVGPQTVTVEPSDTPQPATATPTATATERPTDTPAPSSTPTEIEASPTPVPITELVSIIDAGLVAEGQGWVIAAGRLLWTTNDGDSWRDISPAHDQNAIITNTFFLNSDEGWVVAIPQPGAELVTLPVTIFHTRDGGVSWQQNSFKADLPFGVFTGITDLKYLDRQHGWLVVNQTASMHSSAADLYNTQDGGSTWDVSELPFNGPIYFISPEIGWMTGSCCTGAPRQLFRSGDGGQTWEQQVLVANPVEDDFEYHDYRLPFFFDELEGLLAVTIRDVFYDPVQVGIFQTEDSGETWEQLTTFDPEEATEPGPGSGVQVQFLDPMKWIAAVEKSVYTTNDGGLTWERYEQIELPGWHYQTTLINEREGWSLVFKDNCGSDCLLLYRTSDGGVTWEPVGETE